MKNKVIKTDKINPIEPPCRKTMYNSQADALEAIKYMTEIRVIELKAYKCPVCGFWHLTSK